ncbi:uncharacterized protein LOC125237849 [Leguminivora glycinivorella]|uniref:uncharacterized protein LOC125237849 n=1 Tax=Leguminivora glycinivorella TaxID=1035111 RepID=UPI00200E7847|nr:uncharacterized protein LOC125237849 [Leguminivora glycinivorella]
MLRILWLCAVLGAAVATNCTICLNDQCYSESPFDHDVLLYFAVIDHNYNIMYYYTRDHFNAMELDNHTIIFKKRISNPEYRQILLTVDPHTSEVYFYNVFARHKDPLINKYDPKTNTISEPDIVFNDNRQPTLIYVCNGTVYGVNGKYPIFYLKNGSVEDIPGFENLHILDFMCDKTGVIYVQTRSEMYRIENNALTAILNTSTESDIEYRIPTLGANGDVYLLSDEVTSRRMYHINSTTKEMTPVGAYERTIKGLRDWKFDKHGNIFTDDLFLDKISPRYLKPNSVRCSVITDVKITLTRDENVDDDDDDTGINFRDDYT